MPGNVDFHSASSMSSAESVDVSHKLWITLLNEFPKHVALMKLKITESYQLSKSMSRSILQDVQTMFDLYQKSLVDIVTCRLQHLGMSVADDTILNEVLSSGSLFEIAQNEFATEHLLTNYLSDNMKLISPVAIYASKSDQQLTDTSLTDDAQNCVRVADVEHDMLQYHYVPILDTLKNYLEQPDVWASCQQPKVQSRVLHSFTDGSILSNHECMQHADFIRIHLYSDELEICNPIASRKTVHKLSVFYFLVGNIETKHWSKLSNIHLALLCKFKNVKTIGYQKLLEPLLADMQILAKEGLVIEVDGVSRRLFGTIVTVSGDNLISHAPGGFQSCFTSGRVCRYCMVTKLSLTETYAEACCTLRTCEGHMYHLEAIKGDKNLSAVYGVVCASPFSGLSVFNPVEFFPPDVMHDVLEGLMVVNVGVVLNKQVHGKILNIKQFNERLSCFKFGSADSDKFGPLP
jgi:hypothetical protein